MNPWTLQWKVILALLTVSFIDILTQLPSQQLVSPIFMIACEGMSEKPSQNTLLPLLVKQEPVEVEIKKSEAAFKPPPLPEPEVLHDLLHRWSLSKGDELFFMQLPDSLPGQPPTKEHKPVKTEVQTEDGQSVLKTENQVESF